MVVFFPTLPPKEQLVILSDLAAAHNRVGDRLLGEQSWDDLADDATVLLLLLSGLEEAIDDASVNGVTPNLIVASLGVRAADDDLQWLRTQGAEAPLTDSRARVTMAWHNIGYTLSAMRGVQAEAMHVA
jgi:hypothetical protein